MQVKTNKKRARSIKSPDGGQSHMFETPNDFRHIRSSIWVLVPAINQEFPHGICENRRQASGSVRSFAVPRESSHSSVLVQVMKRLFSRQNLDKIAKC
jgi:hypothetical protein